MHVSTQPDKSTILGKKQSEARRAFTVGASDPSSPFMVVVHKGRHGADLDGVRVVGRVFKQAVVRVEQLSGHQEEKLSGGATVVQPADNTLTSAYCSAATTTSIKTKQIRVIY